MEWISTLLGFPPKCAHSERTVHVGIQQNKIPKRDGAPNDKVDNRTRVDEIKRGVLGHDPVLQLQATQRARELLSQKNAPIARVIEAGVVPRLVDFLNCGDRPVLQYEAAWALTNIAAGTRRQTLTVVNAGAVPAFVKLLSSQDGKVVEQAVWALANIIGDGRSLRDVEIFNGVLTPLLQLVQPDASVSRLRTVAWTLSNLCRHNIFTCRAFRPSVCLPTLARLILHDDAQILTDTCRALSNLVEDVDDRIEELVQSGVVPRLVQLLDHSDSAVVKPVLETIFTIVEAGNDVQKQVLMDSCFLIPVGKLLLHEDTDVRGTAMGVILEFAAVGTSPGRAAPPVIGADLVQPLVYALYKVNSEMQRSIVSVLGNLTRVGTPEEISSLASMGVIPPLCNLIRDASDDDDYVWHYHYDDHNVVREALDVLKDILQSARKVDQDQLNTVCLMIEECGGIDKMRKLQEDGSDALASQVIQEMIDTYFIGQA